eukprot:14790062-Alexandrium_andersonii.AAC.1
MTFWSMVAVAKASHDTLTHFLFRVQKRFDEDVLEAEGGHLPQLACGKAESFAQEYTCLLRDLSWLRGAALMDPEHGDAVFE